MKSFNETLTIESGIGKTIGKVRQLNSLVSAVSAKGLARTEKTSTVEVQPRQEKEEWRGDLVANIFYPKDIDCSKVIIHFQDRFYTWETISGLSLAL